MSVSTKAIKSKIGSVENIKKITRAMELVSVSKMKKAVAAALSARPYAERALEILTNISRERLLDHPLLRAGDGPTLVVVIASNKGLCGSFNVNVHKAAREYMAQCDEVHMVTVGTYAEKFARRTDTHTVASFIDFGERIAIEEVAGLARSVGEPFRRGEYERVVMVYTRYISALKQDVTVRQLLPVDPKNIADMIQEIESDTPRQVTEDMSLYLFEPSIDEILDPLLSRLSEVQLYQALLESQASEHSARMFAMKNATENAEEMIDDLNLSYNRARQAKITREISEIAAGAEALSGR